MRDETFVGAIDQGTTSTRFILFDRMGRLRASVQREHRQIYPRPGWVEHDPEEIWRTTCSVIRETLGKSGIPAGRIAAIGITNQRETVVAWDPISGSPLCNAVVWQDTRSDGIVTALSAHGGIDRFRPVTGLPLATYFSGPKVRWLLENDESVAEAHARGRAVFGTIDSWLAWKLTGSFVTDVTNASRTMLMDLETLDWDPEMLSVFGIRREFLPEILPSVPEKPFGSTDPEGPFGRAIPVAGILGDQQAALFGQACFRPGETKNTYGTGCFMLMNTGRSVIHSRHGLVSTVGYRFGGDAAVYALEGSVAVAGALVQWLRDRLGLISESAQIEQLASGCEDSGGVYFVPAFSGLFAPYWRSDARGIIAGLTAFAGAPHIARAVLEATAFQTRDMFEAMEDDSGIAIPALKVDGGMVVNGLLMQFQSDILGIPVVKPEVSETTAAGSAFAAGLSAGFWSSMDEVAGLWREDRRWVPSMDGDLRNERMRMWKKAVERSTGWVD